MRATTRARINYWGFVVVTNLILIFGMVFMVQLGGGWLGSRLWLGIPVAIAYGTAWGFAFNRIEDRLRRAMRKQVEFEARVV